MSTVIRPRVAAALIAVFALLIALVPAGSGHAAPASKGAAVPYLALGDSLPYGWDIYSEDQLPLSVLSPPDSHVGYPETLANRSPLDVTNAACPGETSASFRDRDADLNSCSSLLSLPPFPGLKVDWGPDDASQLDFALEFLDQNEDTGLVSIQLGANDLFLCQRDLAYNLPPDQGGNQPFDEDGNPTPACTPAEVFLEVLPATGLNLRLSIGEIREVYDGPIVLVGYYSLDYGDPDQNLISQASLQVLEGLAAGFDGVSVADGFAAFEQATRRADGDPCAAGLLLPLGGGICDIHTTPRGDRVMAQAVRKAIDLGGIVSAARSGR